MFELGFGCVLVLNIGELYLKLKAVYSGGNQTQVVKEVSRNWKMATGFISVALVVSICFSIALGVIYSQLDFVGTGFTPSLTVKQIRWHILVPYGFISAIALILISVPYIYYTSKLWNLL